jgi:hypothetical protein
MKHIKKRFEARERKLNSHILLQQQQQEAEIKDE